MNKSIAIIAITVVGLATAGLAIHLHFKTLNQNQSTGISVNKEINNTEERSNTSNIVVSSTTESVDDLFVDSGNDQNGRHLGHIKSVVGDKDGAMLTIDYVLWKSCRPIEGNANYCMDGYDIINSNPQLRNFQVSKDAKITLSIYYNQNHPDTYKNLTLSDFVNIFNGSEPNYPAGKLLYWITIKNGVITEIAEQYQP